MSKYLTPSQQEIRLLLNEADEISKRGEISKAAETRHSFILAKIKALQNGNVADASEESRTFFKKLLSGQEIRQLQEGTQSISYSAGSEGGYLVPQEFHDELIVGMAQFDPLLDEDVVNLIKSDTFALRPYTLPGWDLSTFAATKVAEGAQQVGAVPPTVSGTILNGYKYKASLPVSIELEEDAFQPMMSLMNTAFGIGFARGIGVDLVTGNGTTAPQGVLTGATNSSYTTAANGVLTLNDFEAVYFKVDRWHRQAPRCAWLMTDAVYQMARKAIDLNGNPLLKLIKDKETIMGKNVYVTPSLPAYNPSLGSQAPGSFCVFGDLDHYFVRVSQMVINRAWQLPGYVENGMALYTAIMRADAKVFDPANNGNVIVYAKLHE